MELLFFKYDHRTATPTPTIKQIAALYSPMDLVTAQPDGWNWGDEELKHPWFRVVKIVDALATLSMAQQFLSPLLPVLDSHGVPTTLWQRRAFYLNLAHPIIPTAFTSWWGDDTRSSPHFGPDLSFTATALQLGVARPAINDPAYAGTPSTPLAITA